MRFVGLPTLAIIVMALATTTTTNAQLSPDSVAQPFLERDLDASNPLLTEASLLEARQASNTSATASWSAPVSTASGSVPDGGNATLTEPGCSMTNHLAVNQQASWGSGFVNTCCGFATGTQCWYRKQDTVSAQEECEIPSCDDLESEDSTRMIGFLPLNSTNGSGKYGNIFLSFGMLSPAAMLVPALGASFAVVVASVVLTTLV